MSRRIYTTITNPEFYESLKIDAECGQTNWTISRQASVGDLVVLYVTAPVSAIVAAASVATSPLLERQPSSIWFGHWLADMESLILAPEPISRHELRRRFPEWRYWRQPRNSVRVPGPYVVDVERLIEDRIWSVRTAEKKPTS